MLPEAFLTRIRHQLGEEYEDFLKSLERPSGVYHHLTRFARQSEDEMRSTRQSIFMSETYRFLAIAKS